VPALLINIRIDSKEKFEFFKVTLSDVAGLFEECHIKMRGRYAAECVQFARDLLRDTVRSYEDLQEKDWVAATLDMLRHVRCRSLFLYFEDHKLVASRERLAQTLACFDREKLDYLCYSFFKACKLDVRNILPLGPVQHDVLSEFEFTRQSAGLIGRISPNHYTFSLVSIASVEYFKAILQSENWSRKIYSRVFNGILARIVPLGRRRVLQKMNRVLGRFGATLCLYDPSSPFNLEKVWYEPLPRGRAWKYAVPSQELYANYDDDNGVYAESLIKRGLYPFKANEFRGDIANGEAGVVRRLRLGGGQRYDCTYYSRHPRIRQAPVIGMNLVSGSAAVIYQGETVSLATGETKHFYSNLGPVIQCREAAEVELRVYDQAFQ
jgi:hypothetical protein